MTGEDSIELARAAATAYTKANPDMPYAMRSCWNCNAAHDHLRDAEYPINCFECGRWFFAGTDITIGAPSQEGESA